MPSDVHKIIITAKNCLQNNAQECTRCTNNFESLFCYRGKNIKRPIYWFTLSSPSYCFLISRIFYFESWNNISLTTNYKYIIIILFQIIQLQLNMHRHESSTYILFRYSAMAKIFQQSKLVMWCAYIMAHIFCGDLIDKHKDIVFAYVGPMTNI